MKKPFLYAKKKKEGGGGMHIRKTTICENYTQKW